MAVGIFIDGGAGTTGLEIADRLAGRGDLSLIALDADRRRDTVARREALNDADIAILCLPDAAAREAVALIDNPRTRVIDASSAHRVDAEWTYGFPELRPGQRDAIRAAKRVSNPGCYPTGFLALVAPLVARGLVPAASGFVVNAVSGYSGGGKDLIARMADEPELGYRAYALSLSHKHIAEMRAYSGIAADPIFAPAVIRAYRGMLVDVPIFCEAPGVAPSDALHAALTEHFAGEALVTVAPFGAPPPEMLIGEGDAATDRLDLHVLASEDGRRARLIARLDNLGKGASGAAVQSLNLMAGLEETAGLRV